MGCPNKTIHLLQIMNITRKDTCCRGGWQIERCRDLGIMREKGEIYVLHTYPRPASQFARVPLDVSIV